MKPEDIIKQKISYLNGDDSHNLNDEMLKQVEKDQTLMQELELPYQVLLIDQVLFQLHQLFLNFHQ